MKENKLAKGDVIYLSKNGNNELVLSPQLNEDIEETKNIVINTDDKDKDQIKREIKSAYINNYRTIKVVGKDLRKKAKDIKTILHDLMALEIMEQTDDFIIAKDFLNMKNISIQGVIKRVDLITRAMLIDSGSEENNYESLYNRDEDVNRLTFLAFRFIKFLLNNPDSTNQENTPNNLLIYWQIIDNLEKIADESKRISKFLKLSNIKKNELKELAQLYQKIKDYYLTNIKVYYDNEIKAAYANATNKKILIEKCDAFLNNNHQFRYVPNIIERMKIMVNSIASIGRIVYDG